MADNIKEIKKRYIKIEKPRNLINDKFTYGNDLSPVKRELKQKWFTK